MSSIAYKKNANEVLGRLALLSRREAQDQIFATFVLPSAAMKKFNEHYSDGFITDYPDPHERIQFWDTLYQEHDLLEDDSIPAAYPSEFDQGLYGALFGGDIRFLCMAQDGYVSSGWISSMVPPLLKEWSEFDNLHFDESHPWFTRYVRQLEIMAGTARGKFGISHLIVIDSLNFVFELLGATETYISLYEYPDMVRRAIDFAFDLNVTIHNKFFDVVQTLEGGTCSWVMPWIPGRIICESLDPFDVMSLDDFERWGREPVERMFAEFDGGALHLHADGWHLLESACTLKGLKALLMVDEKDHTPAIDIIEELRRRSGDVPLTVPVDFDEFTERLDRHQLSGGVLYRVSGAPDADTANRCMERVRTYRT